MAIKKAHTITIEWWHYRQPMAVIPERTQQLLDDHAWQQITERLKDGYREGELLADNYRGYWSIETKEAQP